jgi:dipeptidyl aminopeptidase/acylaminoacyl peptidase
MRDSFDLPQVTDVADDASRLRFFEGVAALIDAAAYEQRIMIVLEELQHIPPSSLDLLFYLATRLAGAPVMFVLTFRPNDAAALVVSRLRAFAGSSESDSSVPHGASARRLSLAPLRAEHVRLALQGAAAAGVIPPTHVERIERMAGGNPLRLSHAMRAAAAGEELSPSPVPLRELLIERLQRLSSTQRRVFLVMALLGRPATLSLLSGAAHVSESSCRDAVRVLEQHALIERNETGVQVASTLAAEISLDVAGGAGRAFLSGWIADALTREPNAEPAELARLFAVSGNAPQAFAHARRAAFAFLAKGAVAEATQLFAMARTFATSPEEQAEVEGALAGLGSGRRRLAVGSEAERPLPSGETRDWQHEPTTDPRHSAAATQSIGRWERLFPHWRILFGGALATLLVSALVLGARGGTSVSTPVRSFDTLVVSEGLADATGAASRRIAVGNVKTGFTLGPRVDRIPSDPPWIDTLSRDWTQPAPSPRGIRVAVSRRTARGMDLYSITRDRRDSVVLLADQRSVAPLGWSPDGSWLLATRSRRDATGSAGFDVGLVAFHVSGNAVMPLDTLSGHAVIEAQWSPDGSHIAWVARVGAERHLEVFTSFADGSDTRNVSRHPSEDYHIAWSPDGELLAFTSTRDGNPELYAVDVLEHRLWRLTHDAAHDDRATFAPDGRSLAFESTRGGSLGAYVMPALGGEARAVRGGTRMEVVGWRGPRPRFVDHVRIDVADAARGDSSMLALRAFDESDDSIATHKVEWRVIDTDLVRFATDVDSASPTRSIRGVRAGLGRVVATVGRWRSDTAFVRVGTARIPLLEGVTNLARWRVLGAPPAITLTGDRHTLLMRADRDWDSGILSRATVPLLPGLTLDIEIQAPWDAPPDIATDATLALVVPEEDAVVDSAAPQFLKLASISWKADARRFVYAVGREVYSEPVGTTPAKSRRLAMYLDDDSTVTFAVDGRSRWHSTLRLASPRAGTRAQIWISGRATADQVRLNSISVALAAKDSVKARQ